MKSPLITLLLVLSALSSMAQGTIIGLTIAPANPTTSDNIELYANVSFTSGDCQLDESTFGINGTSIVANAHHCVGLLTVICPTTDTFQIGQLPAGNYTFDFTLTSGFGGPNCSPGIIADDNEQVQFAVSQTVDIEETTEEGSFSVFPNPTKDVIMFSQPTKKTAFIYNSVGQELMRIPAGSTSANMEDLKPGSYILCHLNQQIKLIKN